MGGLTSLASTAIQVLGAVDSYQNRSGKKDDREAQQQINVSNQNAAEKVALEKEQIRVSSEQADGERRAALRRAVARQRAQFGASGVGSNSGSSEAVLLGLFDESDEDRRQRESLDSLKTASVDQGYAQQSRINTLQLTQLRERSRLKNAGNLLGSLRDVGTSIFS
jgi:hypothetical protein